MSSKFQNLYERGSGAWALKYYKERLLTALVEDLEEKEARGVKNKICDLIKSSLKDSVEAVKGIEDGGWLKVHFYERLNGFLDLYAVWNDAKKKTDRVKRLSALRDYKVDMFRDLQSHLDRLKKEGNIDERTKEFYKILSIEKEHNAALAHAFSRLVEEHGDIMFPNLKKVLNRFLKRMEDGE